MQYNVSVVYTTEIPPEDVPDGDNLTAMLDRMEQHGYHLGAWPINEPQKKLSVNEASHVVRSVELNEQGGLTVEFNFIATQRGFELMENYNEQDFKFVPVINEDNFLETRIDIIGGNK